MKSFPGISYELIQKHLPPSTVTYKGHMIRTRKDLRSTGKNQKLVSDARLAVDDVNPPQQICTAIDHEMFCFAALAGVNDDTIDSYLTGKFPVRPFSGMNYIFIAYMYRINAILIKPTKGMNDDNMVTLFKEIYAEL